MNYHVERNPIDDKWKILDDDGFPFGSFDSKKEAEDSLEDMIVYGRLEEICPSKNVDDMTIPDLMDDCHTAFEIMGLEIKNLKNLVKEVYKNQEIKLLYEFIYAVYLKNEMDSYEEHLKSVVKS